MGSVKFCRATGLPEDVSEDSIKTIYRLAGEEDLEAEVENKELARTAHRFCKNCIDRQKLEMKLVDVEVFLIAAR